MAVSTAGGLTPPSLLELLADGRLHSGERLAEELRVSRAAVWKGVLRLRARGIEVQAVPRCGYRLLGPVELLDAARILAAVDGARTERLRQLDVLFEVDSTNTRLSAAEPPPYGRADVIVAELQRAGRGRRGRQWIAPFGASVALSLGWTFADSSTASGALSLCVAVAVARGLKRAGASGIALKWPNDIWFDDRKVGGVLIEMRAEAGGPAHVVIGIGLNVHLRPEERVLIEASGTRVAAVADACFSAPSRNFVAGAIIDELLSMLTEFERQGFATFREAWTALDALHGRAARVLIGGAELCGMARGVSSEGALRLERDGRVEEFLSGEVSLRLGGNYS